MNNLRLIIIALVALMVTGCSDYFDLYPPSDFYEDEIFTDITRSQEYINTAYSGISITPNYTLDFHTDNAVSVWGAQSAAVGGTTTENCAVSSEWAEAIGWIIHINEYLEKGLDVEYDSFDADYAEKVKNRLIGEAYGLRAYYKWLLLKNFAGPSSVDGSMLGIPIIDEYIEYSDDVAASIPRATYMESYNSILSDIEKAFETITFLRYSGSDDITGEQYTGRVSGEMLYALKARMALFAASPAFEQITWEEATKVIYESIIAIDGALIDLQSYVRVNGTVVTYNDYNETANVDYLWRSVFEKGKTIDNSCLPPSLYGQGVCNPSQNLVDAFPSISGYPQTNPDPESPVYSTRDNRFAQFIFHNGDNNFRTQSPNIQLYVGGLDAMNGMRAKGSRTGYYMKKFLTSLLNLDPTATSATTSAYKFSVVFDRSDLYLDFAEAATNACGATGTTCGGTAMLFSAYDAVTKVRAKAGIATDKYIDTITDDDDAFLEMIINERRLEMCFTGERYYDLRRLKLKDAMAATVTGVSITKSDDGLYYFEGIDVEPRYFDESDERMFYNPIPLKEILNSDVLIQNAGW